MTRTPVEMLRRVLDSPEAQLSAALRAEVVAVFDAADPYADDLDVMHDRAAEKYGAKVANAAASSAWAAYQESNRAGRTKQQCDADQTAAFKAALATLTEKP